MHATFIGVVGSMLDFLQKITVKQSDIIRNDGVTIVLGCN